MVGVAIGEDIVIMGNASAAVAGQAWHAIGKIVLVDVVVMDMLMEIVYYTQQIWKPLGLAIVMTVFTVPIAWVNEVPEKF